MDKKCRYCEATNLMNLADCEIKLEKANNMIKILEKCLDTKDELCKALRDDNEELRNKLRCK